jgi:hypothetical protein
MPPIGRVDDLGETGDGTAKQGQVLVEKDLLCLEPAAHTPLIPYLNRDMYSVSQRRDVKLVHGRRTF